MEEISREELEKLIEKMEKEKQAMLEKMTPEEREAAELKAKKLIEEDKANMQQLIEDATAVLGGLPAEEKKTPVCPNCGAPAEGGKFCAFCGSPLTAEDK